MKLSCSILVVGAIVGAGCKKSGEPSPQPQPVVAPPDAAVLGSGVSPAPFPVGIYKGPVQPDGEAYWLQIVTAAGPYGVLEWKGPDTPAAVAAGMQAAKIWSVAAVNKVRLKMFYKCLGGDSGTEPINGFSTLTLLPNGDLNYELVSPPEHGATSWACVGDISRPLGIYHKTSHEPPPEPTSAPASPPTPAPTAPAPSAPTN